VVGVGGRVLVHLRAGRIHVSRRGVALRVSPHVYNGHDDVDALLGALAEVLAA
jgi:selenocysteine lyase/cysteine desulfurase